MGISTKHASEDSQTKYYTAFFEEWEIPVVMFPPQKKAARHTVGFVPSIFLLVQIKRNTGGKANTHTAVHEYTLNLLRIQRHAVYMKKPH